MYNTLTEMLSLLVLIVAVALIIKTITTLTIPSYNFGIVEAYQYAYVHCYLYNDTSFILLKQTSGPYARIHTSNVTKVTFNYEHPC